MLRTSLRATIGVLLATPVLIVIVQSSLAQTKEDSKSSAQPLIAGDKSQVKQSSSPAAVPSQDAAETIKPEKDTGKIHFHLGAVTVGAGYTHFSDGVVVGPFWPLGYPYGFGYRPYFYDSFYYPDYYSSFYGPYTPGFAPYPYAYTAGLAYEMGKGQIKLEVEPKTAEVRIDGAYAGTAEKLKNIWLAPGAYDLRVSFAERTDFQERIYVLSGKTVKIKATLAPQMAQAQDKTTRTEEK